MTHAELVARGEKWLWGIGCKVVLREFQGIAGGEIPDIIGWHWENTFLVECKANRADFLGDKNKLFRKYPDYGMGNFRVFLTPPGLIQPEELPERWGLLYAYPSRIVTQQGYSPRRPSYYFKANTKNETTMLVSALRRFVVRGMLDTIYKPMGE